MQLGDSDDDGVLDILDKEENSRSNCPVDTKGRQLDSDGDQIIDCDDPYPFFNEKRLDRFLVKPNKFQRKYKGDGFFNSSLI